MSRLQARLSLCHRWLDLLQQHLERYSAPQPEPAAVTLPWKDDKGVEYSQLIPADIARNLVRL